ncbi:MAG: GntR family transcriptional regulator [Planctomycetaceae bacterium]|nr:GntR family transcriptional regulator [Planctomycetaceae bacterium]
MQQEINMVDRTPSVGKTMEAIRDSILVQELRKGDIFTESALAESHGVSRGTIRSALFMLENEGLIDTMPNGRKKIVGVNEEFILNLFDTRTMLEQKAVAICIARKSISCNPLALSIAKFYTLQSLPEGEISVERANANTGFHRALFQITENRSLFQCWATLEPLLHALVKLSYLVKGDESDDSESVLIHSRLLEMILRKDPAAIDEIERHINVARDEALDCFRQRYGTVGSHHATRNKKTKPTQNAPKTRRRK